MIERIDRDGRIEESDRSGRQNEVFEGQHWVHDRDGRFCPLCLESAEASSESTVIGSVV